MKIAALETEHQQGFSLPDVTSEETATGLFRWEGSWSYLSTLPWIKVAKDGQIRPGDFPSKGLN
jgi:translation machinery-associated protein 16